MTIWKTYPYSHAFWGTVISIATGVAVHYLTGLPLDTWWLWVWGGVFYAIREVIQWRQKGHWDMPGFVWGVVPSIILAVMAATF